MPADRAGPVAGIVLAAGSSTRMGRNKLLIHLPTGLQILRITFMDIRLKGRIGALGFAQPKLLRQRHWHIQEDLQLGER